jgi:hypothetical protein
LDGEPGTVRRANLRLSLPGRARADWSRAPQFEIRNSKLSWLFSGIHFGMDDWGKFAFFLI